MNNLKLNSHDFVFASSAITNKDEYDFIYNCLNCGGKYIEKNGCFFFWTSGEVGKNIYKFEEDRNILPNCNDCIIKSIIE